MKTMTLTEEEFEFIDRQVRIQTEIMEDLLGDAVAEEDRIWFRSQIKLGHSLLVGFRHARED